MKRRQLIALVNKIIEANGTEEEIEELIDLFLNNVPDPNADAYIFDSEYEKLTPEEIVDKALDYKPFLL